jgi:8-amino-7-oxononanoate synthase
MKDISSVLDKRRKQHLYRERRILESAQGPEVVVDSKQYVAFCSNDYLGLAGHPDLIRALQDAAQDFGVGSGAAHLVCGHTSIHHQLEEELADWVGAERALLFSTGYMANLGIANSLLGRGDRLYEDRLNHASLLDAARMSGARMIRYRHADGDDLSERIMHEDRCDMLASDGVFSMDGDLAPLAGLDRIASDKEAWLLVDDAHGLGVIGADGRGTYSHFEMLPGDNRILMGTLGKAFGCFGAFVAGSEPVIETLIQSARTYIYTTATPPAIAGATLTALGIVRQEGWRREKLQYLIDRFRSGVQALGVATRPSQTPIQPLLVGDSASALSLSETLQARGVLVPAIRPPTVPDGQARLRITLSAAHEEHHIDRLLTALEVAMSGKARTVQVL